MSVFQEFGSLDDLFNSFCRVPYEIWNVEGPPQMSFLKTGDFFSNGNLFGVKPFHLIFLKAAERSILSKMNAKPDKGGSLAGKMLFVWMYTYKLSIATGAVEQMKNHLRD